MWKMLKKMLDVSKLVNNTDLGSRIRDVEK